MQNIEQVFLYMKDEIERQAGVQEKKILEEVKALEEDALTSMQTEAKKDAELRLKQELEEMQSNASTEISESHIERTKKLITQRDAYVKEIFDAAASKLKDFTASKEYKDFMINKIKKAATNKLDHSVLYLRKEDLSLKDELVKAYGMELVAEESEDITIGGFIIENKESALVINETLEFALANQKDWFNKNSGLIIK